jgi:CRISPR/Cas system CSM-associated protein Csm4 (group 5 of RAMP superfamily)
MELKMKKLLITILLITISSAVVYAQPKPPKGNMQKMNPERMLFDLMKRLNLDEDQFSEIKSFVFEAEKKMLDIRSEEVEQKMKIAKKKKAIMDQTVEKITDILDDDQLKMFEQIKNEKEMMAPPPPPKPGSEVLAPPPPPKR